MNTDASLLDLPAAESTVRSVDGIRQHVVAAGPEDGPLVVLLHGFPDFWYGWRRQIGPLVAAGYRVLVPDGRGYNLTDRPEGVGSYRLPTLSRDVAALVGTAGRERAHVVGHDWGGTVAWDLARRHPGVVDHLAVVNAPHPTAYRRMLRSNLRQLRRSWYVFAVQLPRLPEWYLRRNGFAALARAVRDSSARGAFSEADLARYRSAWERAGALTGMLNWYRAAARYRDAPPTDRVEPPTLLLWGERDVALVPELAPASVEHCEQGRLERFPAATHWVHVERPSRVNELLCSFLDG